MASPPAGFAVSSMKRKPSYKTHQRRPLSQRGALYAKGSAAGAMPLLMRAARRQGMFGPWQTLRNQAWMMRRSAGRRGGVSEAVIAAIYLLHDERSVDGRSAH